MLLFGMQIERGRGDHEFFPAVGVVHFRSIWNDYVKHVLLGILFLHRDLS